MAKSKLELTEADARRLAFAQHLIMRAQEDARLPSPLNAAAVLSAQDAVEMVLIVISQTLNLDPNKYKFMAFWEAFAKRGIELPYKESMRRLNDCRVAIKHRGSFPATFDVERVVADAEAFVAESIACAFGTDRAVEGLFGFITYEGVREHLRKARVHLEEHERTLSVEESALAFDELLNEYWDARSMGADSSPFSFSKFGRFDTSFPWAPGDHGFKDFQNHVDKTVKTAEAMDEALRVLSLGLDMDSYMVFKRLTPNVFHFVGGRAECYWLAETQESVELGDGAAEWCFGFVFEAALELSSRPNPAPAMSALLEEGRRIVNERSEAEFERRKAGEIGSNEDKAV